MALSDRFKGYVAATLFLGFIAFGVGQELYKWASDAYLKSNFYRHRFEKKFEQLRPGDSHDRMLELLGPPTHYCPVSKVTAVGQQFGVYTDDETIAQDEIYRIGAYDYVVEFPVDARKTDRDGVTQTTKIWKPATSKRVRPSNPPPPDPKEFVPVIGLSSPRRSYTTRDRCANPY
jgi:hypothetical protein